VARPLRPAEIFATLAEYNVNYVVIGGLAAVLYGSPTITADADICAERTPNNLKRLASAINALHARVRTAANPEGLPFTPDATLLSRMRVLNLTTDYGDLDLTLQPAGFAGYEELVEHGSVVSIGGRAVHVAALDDVIRSKELANRPKDHATLPVLYALRDEIEKRRGQQPDLLTPAPSTGRRRGGRTHPRRSLPTSDD
jgi:hypothetical protein